MKLTVKYPSIMISTSFGKDSNPNREKEIDEMTWTNFFMIRPVSHCKEGCPS
jgi:hypothetical protein